MASQLLNRSQLAGAQLPVHSAHGAARSRARTAPVAMAAPKKVNSYDDSWSKSWFGQGYFAEDREFRTGNYLRKLEKKKVLSNVEKLGLLSKAEQAGLTLSKVEQLGLLSTAERLGLLSLAERALVSDPGAIASLAIPLFVGSIGSLVFVPSEPAALGVVRLLLAATLFGGAGAVFVVAQVIKGLQDDR